VCIWVYVVVCCRLMVLEDLWCVFMWFCFVFLMVIGDNGLDRNTLTTNFEEGWLMKSIKKWALEKLNIKKKKNGLCIYDWKHSPIS
jgi:hypothetical protein